MRFTKNTQQDTSKVLRLPRKMTMDTSKVLRLPRKLQHIFWQRHKSIAPATQNDFQHVAKHVWMSRSATPAKRNEATTRLQPPKRTTSAELPIGTAIRGSRERLRTVADGCERLRTVAIVNATLSEHTLNPQTPRVKREPLLRIREKGCGGMAPDRHTKLAPKTKAWFPSLPMHFAHRIWGKLHSHHSQVRFFFLNTAEKKILKTTRTGPAMFVAL